MKLVIKYTVSDNCTYSCDETTIVDSESAEAFICGFEEKLKKAIELRVNNCSLQYRNWEFSYADRLWGVMEHSRHKEGHWTNRVVDLPEVLTIEEWFQQEEQEHWHRIQENKS